MRILFITKLLEDRNYNPVGLYYLSAALKKASHKCHIVDAIRYKKVIKAIKSFEPDILAYSVISGRYPFFKGLSNSLKEETGLLSVLGGPHPTFRPEIIGERGVDAVCMGEGETSFVDFINRLENEGAYWETPGFWVKRNGNIHRNEIRHLVEDLEDLLPADYSLTDHYPYCRKLPLRVFLASRGCPYNCTYCSNYGYKRLYTGKGRWVRMRAVTPLIREIKYWYNRNPFSFVAFYDPLFGLNNRWVEEFSIEYKKHIALPFSCLMYPNQITKGNISSLKNAGLHWVGTSLEVADDSIRMNTLDRRLTIEEFSNAIEVLRQYGVKTWVGNILGLPGSSLETELETLEINRKLNVDFVDASILTLFPGTRLSNSAEMENKAKKPGYSINPSRKMVISTDVPHNKYLIRLLCLFPIAGDFKLINRFLKLLISLPLNSFYLVLYKMYITYKKIICMYPSKFGFSFLCRSAFYYIFY